MCEHRRSVASKLKGKGSLNLLLRRQLGSVEGDDTGEFVDGRNWSENELGYGSMLLSL